MPYPSPVTYPSSSTYPGFDTGEAGRMIALGDDVVLGQFDAAGVKWSINKFDGYDGSPGSTVDLTQRARGHGATASEAYLTARYMTIEGKIRAQSLDALEQAAKQLTRAVKLDLFQMLVSEKRGVKQLMVRRKGDVVVDPITDTIATYSLLLAADDPLKYGDLVTATTLLPSSTGGMVRPSTWPRTWTGVSNNGVIRVNNAGDEQAPVWLRIDGPIPAGGWTITHQGKEQALTFASSLALAAGEFVTVDMENREVLAQGQAPRAGYVTSRGWFDLDPGDNDIAFSAANFSPTAQLTVTTKPAWS